VGLDDSKLMGRAIGDFDGSGVYTISLACDQVVEVLELGSSNNPWDWKVKTTDGRIGIMNGVYLFPLKRKYQYSSKAKMNSDTNTVYSGQLDYVKGQILEVDKSYYGKWGCLPAKLNNVEGFAFISHCDFI